MTGTFRSPNELMEQAREQMLEGREPSSRKDWYLIMNFLAVNIDPEVNESACHLMIRLYDIPMTDDEVAEVVRFQNRRSSH